MFERREVLFEELIDSTEPSERHAALVNRLKPVLSHDEAIDALANYILAAHGWEQARRGTFDALQPIVEDYERGIDRMANHAAVALQLAERNVLLRAHMQVKASKRGKKAAEQRHGQPGGSRDKREKILGIWSSGKYSSKDLCAEQECAGLEMSFSSARKALRGAPDPA